MVWHMGVESYRGKHGTQSVERDASCMIVNRRSAQLRSMQCVHVVTYGKRGGGVGKAASTRSERTSGSCSMR